MNTQSDKHLPKVLQGLRIPVIAAPLFIISVPKLVIAQCKAGIIGSFPALNARESEGERDIGSDTIAGDTTQTAFSTPKTSHKKCALLPCSPFCRCGRR